MFIKYSTLGNAKIFKGGIMFNIEEQLLIHRQLLQIQDNLGTY